MAQIYQEGDTLVECQENNLVVRSQGNTTSLPVKQIETVSEMSPCATLGKYVDMRVVAIKAAGGSMILLPVTRGGARQILKSVQQLRLQSAFKSAQEASL